MKNVQKPEKIHLGKLIEEIKKGRFVIPDFQREFDWEPWDVRDLIKSIFMDYYIGTLLLWEGNSENYQKLACAPLCTIPTSTLERLVSFHTFYHLNQFDLI
ncbi:MAG: DUF262 domain-containing protein [Flavobacteriaceae bacterium]|nr:DUF262 domain-containing protein [Flavobacteriaceae bacterium]